MTGDISRFPALADMQASHDDLLDRRAALGDEGAAAASFWAEAADFVRRGQATGALLDASRDRRAAQSLLDYWANALYRAGQPPPEARLADFDPILAPELPDEPCPYRGLAAFREDDRDFFFGRERLLNDMLGSLRDGGRLLAIVGSSGSGKSSVVLAGLLPRLRAGALPGSEGWRYVTLVPGSQPLAGLARGLQSAAAAAPELDLAQAARLLFAADGFRRDPAYLAATLAEPAAAPVVLVVDQFEELFTLCADEGARAAFVGQLLGLVHDAGSPHRVILTMRTDFVDNVAKLPDLFPFFRAGRVDVEALDINELRAAIEGPADRVGLKFAEGIVDDLISTILGERAGLPLLQFTLLRLWEKRQRNRVTREVYREVGNPREALERAAEDFWKKLIPEEQETARRILLRMARPGEGREVTSNRIRRDELFRAGEARDRVAHVLDRLIHEARLVKLTEGETAADAQIEVAHEALVRNWPRLVGWLDEEREALRRRLRLTAAAEQWARLGKTADALLRGALLEEAQRYGDLNELEKEFIAASQEQTEAERRAEMDRRVALRSAQAEAQAQAEARIAGRLRRLSWVLAAAFLLAVTAAIIAAIFYNQANIARGLQNEARLIAQREARRARAGELAGVARLEMAKLVFDPSLALLLAIEAVNTTFRGDGYVAANADTTLQSVVETVSSDDVVRRVNLRGHVGSVNSAAFSLDGKTLITAGSDNTARLWDVASGQEVRQLTGHTGWVNSAAFSPDDNTIVTASADGTARLWDVYSGQELRPLLGHMAWVTSAVFSPDGKRIVTVSHDGTARLWDVANGQEVRRLQGHTGYVHSAAFSPDGKSIVTASYDRTARLWDAASGQEVRQLQGHTNFVFSAAFSPDGKTIVTASADGTVRLWDAASSQELRRLQGHTSFVNSAAFSPDGKTIVTASGDHTARLWDAASGQELRRLQGHTGYVFSAAFSPDGKTIITASWDGTVRLWVADIKDLLARAASLIQRAPPVFTEEERRQFGLGQ